MNSELLRLINDYRAAVAEAVEMLQFELGLDKPRSVEEWVLNGIPQVDVLSNGVKYFKHGIGCIVGLPGRRVDFDFGAGGRYDGFEPSRLYKFSLSAKAEYSIRTRVQLDWAFEEALRNGEIIESKSTNYYFATDA